MHNKIEENFEREYFEMFGLKKSDLPALMIIIIHKEIYKFKYEGELEIKKISKFLIDFS